MSSSDQYGELLRKTSELSSRLDGTELVGTDRGVTQSNWIEIGLSIPHR